MATKTTGTCSGSGQEPSLVLRYMLGDLEAMERAELKDKAWGHAVCKESRAAHLRALRDDASREDILTIASAMQTLLPSLGTLAEKVPDAECFLKNVSWRIKSLMSIAEGGDPVAPSDATPEEQKLVAVYVKAKRQHQHLRELLGAHAKA